MAFNMEKGLVNMGQGFLSGYSTLLTQKSEQSLEQKRNDAQLQREKNLAKYKNDMLQTQKTTQLKEQRTYDEDLAKRTSVTEYVTQDGGEITREALDAMDPQQRSSLLSRGDYNIDMKEKENAMALDQAEAVTKRKHETTKGITDADTEAKINKVVDYVASTSGWDEGQKSAAKEYMAVNGITTEKELQSSLKAKNSALSTDEQNKIAETARKKVDSAADKITNFEEAAISLGIQTDNYEDATIKVRKALDESYYAEELMRAGDGSPSTKAGLTLPANQDDIAKKKEKVAQMKSTIQQVAGDVMGGKIRIDQVEAKNPQLAAYVKQQIEAVQGKKKETPDSPNTFVDNEQRNWMKESMYQPVSQQSILDGNRRQ